MSNLVSGSVSYDDMSFKVGGKRVWLHVGELHYFRHPAGGWDAALRRLKAAGLNTVSTYVAWNFHAPDSEEARFTGDRDLGLFLDLAKKHGLYVIARPGPYICSEWDGGGLPAWLLGKPGIRTRENDPVYMRSVERWFEQVLPVIVPRQVSRGGAVILVQNENEYDGGWNESTRSYIRRINEIFRSGGVDVPIIACNCHGRPPSGMVVNGTDKREDQMIWPDMLLTYNWGPGAECIRRLREVQPDKPLLMTEYWSGPQAFWGKPLSDYCAVPEYGRSMLEFVSLGCQITYYMFDGGTNFEWWAGRNIVTSYQSNYPVREGGGLWSKYYQLKPVNHFISQFGGSLSESREVDAGEGVSVSEGSRMIVRSTPEGRLIFVSDERQLPVIQLNLPGEVILDVAMPSLRSFAVPYGYEALPGLKIDYSNVGLLGMAEGAEAVVLWGVAGTEARVSIGGKVDSVLIESRKVKELKFEELRVYIVDEVLAGHTWFPDNGEVVFGSDYAEEDGNGGLSVANGDWNGPVYVAGVGGLRKFSVPAAEKRPDIPKLSGWKVMEAPERFGLGEGWTELHNGPASHEELGRYYGYVWYKAQYEAAEEGYAVFFAPMRSSRMTVYSNGMYCGTTGELTRFVEFCGYRHPADAIAQDQVLVPLKKGLNNIVMLSDHLGRWFNGKPDIQGLRGPVYLGARRVPVSGVKEFAPAPVDPDAFKLMYEREYRTPEPLPGVEVLLDVPEETDVYMQIPSGLKHVAVSVDGNHVAAMPKSKYPFTPVRLPESAAGRQISLRIQSEAAGRAAPPFENIGVYYASRRDALRRWAWKPGGECPGLASHSSESVSVSSEKEAWAGLMPDQKSPTGSGSKPGWFSTRFQDPVGSAPVFLHIGQMHKGQIYLNGHNAGRFWQVGGYNGGNGVQSRYYLPRDWMQGDNSLVIFEEYGIAPEGVVLQW